ncbi:endonuclease VII domain-containing protein [Acinetobacter baumannii]|uniref:Recombination endonuclease VII n=1 Tax=Acinetobacter baumannii TaxID=470 RepID=A0AAJ0QSB2_ACIBA|nr:endonuclease VII domain-containing protein [Acinetobacter baumannii]KZA07100.1 Recombination endonuclease VII [Acinetobacter baumannii]
MPDVNRVCIDCKKAAEESGAAIPKRKPALNADGTPVPGNRCITHERARKKRRRTSARERNWSRTYGISAEEYWLIYAEQGGTCAICQRAKGIGKKPLCVDHDHETGMVRGLLCNPCNADVLGHARDDISFFERAIDYLTSPPAVRAIGRRVIPEQPEE